MRRLFMALVTVAVAGSLAAAAFAEGSDPTARATFMSKIKVNAAKATLNVKYRGCAKVAALTSGCRRTVRSGLSAARLTKATRRTSAAWCGIPIGNPSRATAPSTQRCSRSTASREGDEGSAKKRHLLGAVLHHDRHD